MKTRFDDLVEKNTNSCNLCGKYFKTEERLFMHIGITHNKLEEILNALNTQDKGDTKDLNETALKLRNSSSEIVEEKGPDLHCQFCSEKINEVSDLIEHLKVHMRPMKSVEVVLQCAVEACTQTFDYHYHLNKKEKKVIKSEQFHHFEEHLRAKHTKTARKSCKICGKNFFSTMSLIYHIKQHKDKSKFYCTNCEHFIHSNNYEKHISISNCAKQNEAYSCEFCGKGFAHQINVVNHRKIHTNEKEFKCTLCLKSFHQKGNLETHKKKKHM